jgi:hypothetical protein
LYASRQGIPADLRAARDFDLKKKDIGEDKLAKVRALNKISQSRGKNLVLVPVPAELFSARSVTG